MKKRFSVIFSTCLIIISAVSCSTADVKGGDETNGDFSKTGEMIREGAGILNVTFPAPERQAQRDYLGVDENRPFMVSDIDADLVIVEIFSMYCPHCQREAPLVNELYEQAKRAEGRVKIIGIGVGNSDYEVDLFRKSYEIEFPLFPDGDFVAHKKIGASRTPTFIGVKNRTGGKSEIVSFHVGGIEDADSFLKKTMEEAGM